MKSLKRLIGLIQKSPTLSKERKGHLYDAVENLPPERSLDLVDIFLVERNEMKKIDDDYQISLKALEQEMLGLVDDFEHRMLPDAAKKAEKKTKKADLKSAEKILKQID